MRFQSSLMMKIARIELKIREGIGFVLYMYREEDEDEKEEGKASVQPLENTPKPTKLSQILRASNEVMNRQSEEAASNVLKPVANNSDSVTPTPAPTQSKISSILKASSQLPSKPTQKASKPKKKTAILA